MTTTERLTPAEIIATDLVFKWKRSGNDWPEVCGNHSDLIEAIAAALSSTLEAPADWVLVPREPTEAMLHAGGQARMYPSVHMSGPSAMAQREAYRIYRAMIAAIGPVMNPCPECGKEIEQCPH
jgi:hypothetical protein